MIEYSEVSDYIKLYNTASEFVGHKDCPFDYFKEHQQHQNWSNQRFGNLRGVYFLLQDNEVVYVGLSRYSIGDRVLSHLRDKKFDSVKYIDDKDYGFISSHSLELVEYVFINIFNPKYNKLNKHYMYNN